MDTAIRHYTVHSTLRPYGSIRYKIQYGHTVYGMMYDVTHCNSRCPHVPNEGQSDDFTSSVMQWFLSWHEIFIADSLLTINE